jgi:hypothetical protein
MHDNLELFECKCGKRKILRNIGMWSVAPILCPECETLINIVVKDYDPNMIKDDRITGVLLVGGIQ